jgi:hypothetical protein
MGRDVMVYAWGGPLLPVGEMPPGWRPRPMGSRREVRARLQAVLGPMAWVGAPERGGSGSSGSGSGGGDCWGVWRGPRGARLEVHLGAREPVAGLRVHVAGDTEATALLLRVCAAHGWAAVDAARGAWLAPEAPTPPPATPESGDRFLAYRDAVLQVRLARREP